MLLSGNQQGGGLEESSVNLEWEDCEEQINLVALSTKEPILFYDDVGDSDILIVPLGECSVILLPLDLCYTDKFSFIFLSRWFCMKMN